MPKRHGPAKTVLKYHIYIFPATPVVRRRDEKPLRTTETATVIRKDKEDICNRCRTATVGIATDEEDVDRLRTRRGREKEQLHHS